MSQGQKSLNTMAMRTKFSTLQLQQKQRRLMGKSRKRRTRLLVDLLAEVGAVARVAVTEEEEIEEVEGALIE